MHGTFLFHPVSCRHRECRGGASSFSSIQGQTTEKCNFILPAIVQRGDLVLTVSTSGKSPALAKKLRRELETFYQEADLAPPTIKEVMAKFSSYQQDLVKEVLAIMIRDNALVKVTEELYFYKPAMGNLKEKLVARLAGEGEIDTPAFKDMTGLSRKFSIPLLEYFDKIKVTIRVGDKRLLREKQDQ